jgi:ribosomal protein S18 acetylase RimI-like enzyme
VSRQEARKLRKQEGTQRQQLARLWAARADERQKKLDELRARKAKREAKQARLRDPALRCTTFSGLKLLQNPQLIEQLLIRRDVDGRTESTGKRLICSPPPKGGRAWLVLKLQALLELEFKEGKLAKRPNDLKKGDLGCDSRAPRKQQAPRQPAAAKGGKGGKGGGKGKKETWKAGGDYKVECILDKRGATQAEVDYYAAKYDDANVVLGGDMYLVAWVGWTSTTWEPYSFITDDELIVDYEASADAAEDEAAEEAAEEAEEDAAEAAAAAAADGDAAMADGDGDAAMADGDGDDAAPMETEAPPAPAHEPPRFISDIVPTVPAALLAQLEPLEHQSMRRDEQPEPFPRNGAAFADYLGRWDLHLHLALSADGKHVEGFCISGAEGRGQKRKVFIYELHVAQAQRRRGIARALIDVAERSAGSKRGGTPPLLELNVHCANEEARAFYEHLGFGAHGETRDRLAVVMRRQRA